MLWWWNGRHEGLKIPCLQRRVGSNPTRSTNQLKTIKMEEHTNEITAACSAELMDQISFISGLNY